MAVYFGICVCGHVHVCVIVCMCVVCAKVYVCECVRMCVCICTLLCIVSLCLKDGRHFTEILGMDDVLNVHSYDVNLEITTKKIFSNY